MVDTCVMCGEYVPEGRQVCITCQDTSIKDSGNRRKFESGAVRHYMKWHRGDNDEHHDRAFAWNLLCCIWTCQNIPELNDYRKVETNNE